MIKFKSNTIKDIAKKLELTDNDIDEMSDDILTALGGRLLQLIQKKAPKKSGKYADSWKLGDVNNNIITVSSPDGKLFTILEFTGKRKTHIEAEPGKVLHFVIDGKDIFVKFSNPGPSDAQPHVVPSLEELGREGKEIILKIVKRRFPIFE